MDGADIINTLKEIRIKAIEQLNKEFQNLEDQIGDKIQPTGKLEYSWFDSLEKDEVFRLVRALLNLYKITNDKVAFALSEMFWTLDGVNSRYSNLGKIARSDRCITLAADIDELVNSLSYDILDDGYLRLVRVEYIISFPLERIKDEKHVQYFLTCNEWITRKEVENKVLNLSPSIFKNRVDTIHKIWFGSIDKFDAFLEVIGDPNNYEDDDPYFDKLANKIDELMVPSEKYIWQEGDDEK